MVFGGDFRQTLPVVHGGSRQETVGASIANSYMLWNKVQVLYLTENMRLDRSDGSVEHAEWLKRIGAGEGLDESGRLDIPARMCCGDMTELVDGIYPGIRRRVRNDEDDKWFLERTIL